MLSSGDGLSYVYDGWGRRAVSTTSTGSRYSFYGPEMTLLSETNVSTQMMAAARRAAGVRQTVRQGNSIWQATPQPSASAPTPAPMATLGSSRQARQTQTLHRAGTMSAMSPTVAFDYIWFGGRPVAQTDSTGLHYTVADHLGTPLLQTDASANVYFRMETEP